jgi:hypothetical protein
MTTMTRMDDLVVDAQRWRLVLLSGVVLRSACTKRAQAIVTWR